MNTKKQLNDLTVFVIQSGNNPNYNDCLQALKNQSVDFSINVIENYSPMSRAFQEMLNRCQTKYFIQCDSDIILDINAIENMYNEMQKNKISMICFQLKDVHLNFDIFGIKIYDYEIFKKYPYNLKTISCEMEQLNRIEKDGHKWKFDYNIVGKHSPKWTTELIFDRYFDLMKKFKKYKYGWMKNLPVKLLNIYNENKNEINLYALLGCVSGLITEDENKEKDTALKNSYYKYLKELL